MKKIFPTVIFVHRLGHLRDQVLKVDSEPQRVSGMRTRLRGNDKNHNVIPAKAGIHFFLLFFLFLISTSHATAPVSINLSYDLDGGILHVEADHPSFNLDKSYVRMMNVYLNGQQVSTLNYFRQN